MHKWKLRGGLVSGGETRKFRKKKGRVHRELEHGVVGEPRKIRRRVRSLGDKKRNQKEGWGKYLLAEKWRKKKYGPGLAGGKGHERGGQGI